MFHQPAAARILAPLKVGGGHVTSIPDGSSPTKALTYLPMIKPANKPDSSIISDISGNRNFRSGERARDCLPEDLRWMVSKHNQHCDWLFEML
jgi:hypothetical protein